MSLDLDAFRTGLRTLLDDIRTDAVAAESEHRLLHERVRDVLGIGFGALRVPRDRGGAGASFADVIDVVIGLAAADSNLSHLLRGHVVFAEMLRLEPDADARASRWDRWAPRFLAGELVGNAQSERGATADISTTITRDGTGGARLDGTKFYTTGSIYADWIYLVANDPDEPTGAGKSGVAVAAATQGVESVDDWDGIGQQLTGSGTTTFTSVPLDGAEVLPVTGDEDFRARALGGLFQLYLLAVVAGIAQAIVRDTVDYVRPRRRLGGYSGEAAPREDGLVQAIVGDLASAAHTARVLVRASAADYDGALAAREAAEAAAEAGDADAAATAAADAEQRALEFQLGVFKAQQVVLRTVLAEANELFEVGGATAVTRGSALDRHWRNVRTIASHNPAIQRRRAIGDYELNGTLPQRARAAQPGHGTAELAEAAK